MGVHAHRIVTVAHITVMAIPMSVSPCVHILMYQLLLLIIATALATVSASPICVMQIICAHLLVL